MGKLTTKAREQREINIPSQGANQLHVRYQFYTHTKNETVISMK